MKLTKLTAQDASSLAVATLGLDADAIGLTSPEGAATSLRRAASFYVPSQPPPPGGCRARGAEAAAR